MVQPYCCVLLCAVVYLRAALGVLSCGRQNLPLFWRRVSAGSFYHNENKWTELYSIMQIKLISRLKFSIVVSIKLCSSFDKELKTHVDIQSVMVLMVFVLIYKTFRTEAIQQFWPYLNYRSVLLFQVYPSGPRGLWRLFAAAGLLVLWVRMPPGAWMSVCCESPVMSGRGLCVGLISRPEESYRVLCV